MWVNVMFGYARERALEVAGSCPERTEKQSREKGPHGDYLDIRVDFVRTL